MKAGQPAGSTSKVNGYLEIRIDTVLYSGHRLAWLYMTGHYPSGVDHRNRIRSDNRWPNLRLADQSQNGQNKSMQKNNTSGYRGVSFCKNRWVAEIWVRGKKKYLGSYRDAKEANEVAMLAREMYFGEFCCHG